MLSRVFTLSLIVFLLSSPAHSLGSQPSTWYRWSAVVSQVPLCIQRPSCLPNFTHQSPLQSRYCTSLTGLLPLHKPTCLLHTCYASNTKPLVCLFDMNAMLIRNQCIRSGSVSLQTFCCSASNIATSGASFCIRLMWPQTKDMLRSSF